MRQPGQRTRYVPPFKPLPAGAARPLAQQPEHQRLVVQQNSSAPMRLAQDEALRIQRLQQEAKLREQQRYQQELLAMQIIKEQRLQQSQASHQQQMLKLQQAQNNKRTQVF